MKLGFVRSLLVVVSLGLVAFDCGPAGELVGVYDVTFEPTDNDTCGEAVAAVIRQQFLINLRVDGRTALWITNSKLEGKVDESNSDFDFDYSGVLEGVPPSQSNPTGCYITRRAVLAFTVNRSQLESPAVAQAIEQGAVDPDLLGTAKFTFTPVPGTFCEDALLIRGGGYATLPCSVTTDVVGTLRD